MSGSAGAVNTKPTLTKITLLSKGPIMADAQSIDQAPADTKKCARCGATFARTPAMIRYRYCYCRECRNENNRKSRAIHGGKYKIKTAQWRAANAGHVRLRAIWSSMIRRCHDEGCDVYRYYGGRGIKVCQRWRDSFDAFVADMGPRPDGYQIDRIDNGGNYEPGNCRWVDRKTQCRNRRSSRVLEFRGEKRTIAEWSEVTGIGAKVIEMRLRKCGYTVERALTQPVKVQPSRGRKGGSL